MMDNGKMGSTMEKVSLPMLKAKPDQAFGIMALENSGQMNRLILSLLAMIINRVFQCRKRMPVIIERVFPSRK